MAKAPIDIRSLARTHSKAAITTLASIMYEPKCKASDRINAAEALLNRGYGKATQLVAPADDARLGFTEIKLVIIDTARSPQNAGLEQRSENASIIEHVDHKHDDTALDPILIEAKPRD